jgi:hypothetical protein
MIRKFKEFILESKQDVLIIKKGHKLFHSSVEKIILPLRVGGYDNVLWTAEDSGISQTYIPVSSSIYINTNSYIKPQYDEYDRHIQTQMGIDYDYSDIKWKNNMAISYKMPDIFKDIYNEYYKKREALREFEAEYKQLLKEYEKDPHNVVNREKTYKYKIKLKELEQETYGNFIEKKENEIINNILINNFGYQPYANDKFTNNHSWKLKYKTENGKATLLPSEYRNKGNLYILTPKRDLRIFDYTRGHTEGDLTDVDYNKINLFRTVEENGYDGIQIHDFAQVESEGNFGHKSIGLFKNTISDLNVDILYNVEHPTEKDFEEMYRTRNWESKEYKNYNKK